MSFTPDLSTDAMKDWKVMSEFFLTLAERRIRAQLDEEQS